ncbi:MAG: metal-dependent transcriptional regulator [Ruminococcus sp.]|nr:metal-dependent transcriptional regulator [Ruminococcus sp.]
MTELSYSQKKYLFAIYKLSCTDERNISRASVRSTELADMVGVSKASTASMTAKLSEAGFIEKEHYGQIRLTEGGIKAASPIYSGCVIIKEFLKSLGLDDKTADSDAVKIVIHASQKAVTSLEDHILAKTLPIERDA